MNMFILLRALLALAGGAALAAAVGWGLARWHFQRQGDELGAPVVRERIGQAIATTAVIGFFGSAIGLLAARRDGRIPHFKAALLGTAPGATLCFLSLVVFPPSSFMLPLAFLYLGLPGAAASGLAAAVWKGGLRGTA